MLVYIPDFATSDDLRAAASQVPAAATVLIGPGQSFQDWSARLIQACQRGASIYGLLEELSATVPEGEARGEFQQLARLAEGMHLTGEASPRSRERVFDFGARLAALRMKELTAASVHPQRSGEDTFQRLCDELKPAQVVHWAAQPGLYTGDPEMLSQARLLKRVDYLEAEELCRLQGLGDPGWIDPLRRRNLPALWKGFSRPDDAGTQITHLGDTESRVRAVVRQSNVALLSLESATMWRSSGFLAQLFAALARHQLSVDLLATSQTNVTLTLDTPDALRLLPAALPGLREELQASIEVSGPCATVTLVGNRLRTLLPHLGPALEVFDEEKIHLVSQASSDLSLSFVVDEEQSSRLVKNLHHLLFGDVSEDQDFGPSYEQVTVRQSPKAELSAECWWARHAAALVALAERQSPRYVYHRETLLERAHQLQALESVQQRLYAIKANAHRPVVELFWKEGLGLECVSPGEIALAKEVTQGEATGRRLLYTPNFAPAADYEAGFAAGATVTLDSLAPLQQWPERFEGRSVFLRLDSGIGAGHHRHVQTGGNQSKFGISQEQFGALSKLLKAHRVRVEGLHCHAGSGVMDPENWLRVGKFLSDAALAHFPDVEVLDLGGGLGVPDRTRKPHLDLKALERLLKGLRSLHSQFQLWVEPGRFLVAEAGVLLATVTQIKKKGDKYFIGLDTGMNSLIRPALYGAYHDIVNLTRLDESPQWRVDVVGPICETGDILGRDRWLPRSQPGDVFLISTAGAYGRVMSSQYNLRQPADEVLWSEE